jgi:pimeloyl-ACP methyl ester carboxylesterase
VYRICRLLPVLAVLTALVASCRDSAPAGRGPSPAATAGAGTRELRLDAGGGVSLAARLYGGGTAGGVVLAPDAGRGIAAWDAIARELAATGLTALAYDAPGHGGSPPASTSTREDALALAGVAYLRSLGVEKVALVGEGTGAAAALAAAARDPVIAVAAISTQAGTGQADEAALTAAAAKLATPVLFMAALGDGSQAALSQRLYDAADEPRTLAMVPGTGRGTELFAGAATAARDVLREFLRTAFAPRSAQRLTLPAAAPYNQEVT